MDESDDGYSGDDGEGSDEGEGEAFDEDGGSDEGAHDAYEGLFDGHRCCICCLHSLLFCGAPCGT